MELIFCYEFNELLSGSLEDEKVRETVSTSNGYSPKMGTYRVKTKKTIVYVKRIE